MFNLRDFIKKDDISYFNMVYVKDLSKVFQVCEEVFYYSIASFNLCNNPNTYYNAQHPLAPFVMVTNSLNFFDHLVHKPQAQGWKYHSPGVREITQKLWLFYNPTAVIHNTIFSTCWFSTTESELAEYLALRTFLRQRYGWRQRRGLTLTHVLLDETLVDSPLQNQIIEPEGF